MIDSIILRLDNPQSAPAGTADNPQPTPHSRPVRTASVRQPATPSVRGQSEDKLYYVKLGRNGQTYVQLSLPKWKSRGGGNVWPVTKAEAREIFLELQSSLASIGIVTDIFKAVVTRLDLFANAATDYSYSTFKPLLDSLVIPRRTRAVYPNSVRFENKRQVDIVYDKREQQASKGFSVEQLPPNLIRWEYRLMVQDAVRAVTGATTLEDLFTRWETLHEVYKANLRSALRYDDDMAGQVVLAQDIAYIVKNRPQVARALYSKLVVEQTGSVDGIKAILRDAGATRQQIYRETMTVLEGLAYPIPSERVSLNALRVELYQKLMQGLGQ
jgi:hypothetical protein